MNCANHPQTAAVFYCQQCGKPMCQECARPVAGLVNCESCLASRLGIPPGGQPGPYPPTHPNPLLAGLLGFIPGVGAMYNGQFVKALVHVLIFAVLVSLSHGPGFIGLFVMAWVFYQVFDAYQTARARRDGLPLPNPFGLNDLGTHLGITPPGAVPPGAMPGGMPDPGPGGMAAGSPWSPGPPVVPEPHDPSGPEQPLAGTPFPMPPSESHVPTGAIVLIVVGILLLFDTLGIVRAIWIGRSWPLLFVGLGVWLALRGRRDSTRRRRGPRGDAQ
jgi:TM2 domain-containing membrane protein YozV